MDVHVNMDSFLPYCKFDLFLQRRISVIFMKLKMDNFWTNENWKLIKLFSWGADEQNTTLKNQWAFEIKKTQR